MRPSIGVTGTFITGWALFIGVIGIASGSLAGAGFFAASFLAVVMACVTVGARLLFSWGNEGLTSSWFGKAHPKHRTPANSIYFIAPLVAIPTIWVLESGVAPLAATTYIDTVGVFGYMLAYIIVYLGAPLFLKKINAAGGS